MKQSENTQAHWKHLTYGIRIHLSVTHTDTEYPNARHTECETNYDENAKNKLTIKYPKKNVEIPS